MKLVISLLLSYLIGSIPSGFLLTKFVMKKDVREYGSGNIGATNVARIMGLKAGVLVAFFDILKGYIALMVGQYILGSSAPELYILLIAAASIAGHDWSVFLGFSGGKGVATTFGVILRLYPAAFVVYAVIWLLIVFKTRYVSLGSILGSVSLPFTVFFTGFSRINIYFSVLLSLFIMYTHRANIKRLINGNENRMDPKKLGSSGKNE